MNQNNVALAMAEYKKNFYNIYYKEVLPYLMQFEEQRKLKLCKFVIGEFILLIIAIIGLWCLITGECIVEGFYLIFSLLGLVCAGFVLIYPYLANKDFCKILKNQFRYKLCSAFGQMEWLQGAEGISNTELIKSDLFGAFDTRTCDDLFRGKLKDVNFTISETYMRQVHTGVKYGVDVFKGIIIKFDVNKTVKNKTIITSKKDKFVRGYNTGYFIIILSILQYPVAKDFILLVTGIIIFVVLCFFSNAVPEKKEELNTIKLEDSEFNRRYNCFSSDEVEGRYLVTPAFMERFMNLETAFGSNLSKCSFYNNSLMIAISTNKNLFEIGNLFHKVDDPKQFAEFFNELASILVLIDYFKLNEKTGL